MQVIAAPVAEDVALRVARALERDGVCAAKATEGMGLTMDINLPDVVAEVEAAFARYETALTSNDVATLDASFWDGAEVIRYGMAENLYGAGRDRRVPRRAAVPGLMRSLSRTVITSFGRDFATASTLFERDTSPGKIGRQMQSWVRLPEGWRVVAAHVSLIDR